MNVKVGLRQYEVVKQDEIVEVGGELYGKCDSKDSTITIANKFDQLQKNETFLHEVIHAVCKAMDLRDIDNCEHSVELLSKGLHMVIADNPHIFKMEDI